MTEAETPSHGAQEAFQPDPEVIRWKLHFRSEPAAVFDALATAQGRARFWAESAEERDWVVHFVLPGGLESRGRVLDSLHGRRFVAEYFGWSVRFDLSPDGVGGGTDLEMTCRGVAAQDRVEVIAGWVSVLMAMKAAVDFGVDLRNHDPERTWWQGYADN